MLRLAFFGALLCSLLACSEEPYDESWGSEEIPTGKADGLLDSAVVLQFDATGTGYVEQQQMDVYAIDLRNGDKITATMSVTSGDLSPHFTLYYGGSTYIGSATFQRQTSKIVKTYELESTGRHYIAVKAYQGDGAGRYSFSIACNGGPCAGEPYVRELSVDEQAECIGKARVCSFAALPQYNGSVGPARARTIFDGCMDAAQTELDGVTCSDTCAVSEQARGACDSVIAALPFYADQSAACFEELADCLDTCFSMESYGGYSDGELWDTAESTCWDSSLNGNCNSYARGHADCGGTYADDTNEECHELCESTNGAWVDDLDVMCEEDCD